MSLVRTHLVGVVALTLAGACFYHPQGTPVASGGSTATTESATSEPGTTTEPGIAPTTTTAEEPTPVTSTTTTAEEPTPVTSTTTTAEEPVPVTSTTTTTDTDDTTTTTTVSTTQDETTTSTTTGEEGGKYLGCGPMGECQMGSECLQITGIEGNFCAPLCDNNMCPPTGGMAQTQCVLGVGMGEPTHCAALCPPDNDAACPAGTTCKEVPDQPNPIGVCTAP